MLLISARSSLSLPAIAYGQGVYFATSANYSARDLYSPPDAQGHKHVYYCRVLTGLYTRGQSGIKEPPEKDLSKPGNRYDSVADCSAPGTPSIFVVFSDTQAYPEYLITFT